MKRFFTGLILIMSFAAFAQEPVVVKLWADGPPNSNGLTGEERMLEGGRVSNVIVPTLTVYPAKNGNGMAVISCPGGGYTHLAMNHEGYDMAPWFNEQGITYAVLKYRMPNGHFDAPLSDVQQAIRLMRLHADEWKFDPDKLGIMGASAGGHLAATAATHFTSNEDRPDFQILLYPLIILNERFAKGMFGEHPSDEMIKKYTSDFQVTDKTPQAIIFCSTDDRTVTPEHGIRYYTALINHGVSASIHIYPTGMHGWGYKDTFTYKRQWTGELEKWLREINKSLSR